MIVSCYTLSNAFNISRSTLQTSSPSSNDLDMSYVIDKSWLTQESPGLKPDSFYAIRLFSRKTENILLNIKILGFCYK